MSYSTKQCATALYELINSADKKSSELLAKNFVNFLTGNNLVSKTDKIISEFEMIWKSKKAIMEVEINTARKIDKSTIEYIKSYLQNNYKVNNIIIDSKIDSTILGGILIKIGDRVIDATLKTKLNNLKTEIIK